MICFESRALNLVLCLTLRSGMQFSVFRRTIKCHFGGKPISSPDENVLNSLLYHESDLRIEEHYTDTAGFTDHVFALMHLFETKLYIPKGNTAYGISVHST